MVQIERASFENNPFVGLFLKASEHLLLVPPNAPSKLVQQGEKVLGVKVVSLFLDNSVLLGLFSAINSPGAVWCEGASQEEIKILKQEGLNVMLLPRLSPGNNILANDKAALVSPKATPDELKQISDTLGVEAIQQRISNQPLLAPTTVVTNKGVLAFNELTDTELKQVEKIFGVKGAEGTSNLGTPYNSLAVVANSKGALIGMTTTGFEAQRIYQ